MKLASRVIGVLLIACAFGLCAIFMHVTLSDSWGRPTGPTWTIQAAFLGIALALALAGWSYLRFDPDAEEKKEEPASETTEFLIVHRADLKTLAQIGLVLSLTRAVLALVGSDWPGRWADFVLAAWAVVLIYWGRKMASPTVNDNSDWKRVPEWIRKTLPAAWLVAFWSSIILLGARQWFHIRAATDNSVYDEAYRFVSGLCLSVLYAVEALYFSYGELRPASDAGSAEEESG